MNRAAAILAGGESSRLRNKAMTLFAGEPMILHVIDKCKDVVDELLVIVNTREQENNISRATREVERLRIVLDRSEQFLSPLLGARTAFENSKSKLTLLLPCDAPLIKTSVLDLLFRMIGEWDVVIPRHPNGYVEPLHAVFKTDISRKLARDVISSGKRSMKDLITRLNALYLSTNIIQQLDPQLESFANVNTVNELRDLQKRVE
nr:molybdenum cofactor guanylyltransferase [Candidatus Njordarchaeota archaeon]